MKISFIQVKIFLSFTKYLIFFLNLYKNRIAYFVFWFFNTKFRNFDFACSRVRKGPVHM